MWAGSPRLTRLLWRPSDLYGFNIAQVVSFEGGFPYHGLRFPVSRPASFDAPGGTLGFAAFIFSSFGRPFPHGIGYPSAGCAPAEPASVSPNLSSSSSLPEWHMP